MSRNHPNKSEMRRLQKRAERRRKQPSPDNLMGLVQFTHGQYRGETPLARAKAKECAQ